MKAGVMTGAGAAVLALAWGCASGPNPTVLGVRAEYDEASRNAQIGQFAPLALDDARKTMTRLEQADKAGESQEEIDHLAYLTRTQLDTARVSAEDGALRDKVGTLTAQRDDLLLAAKSDQVRKAERESDQLRSEMAMRDAEERERLERLAQPGAPPPPATMAQPQPAPPPAPLAQPVPPPAPPPPPQVSAQQERARSEAEALERQGGPSSPLRAEETAQGIVLTLGHVVFESGQSELQPGANDIVARIAQYLNEFPERPIEVAGHTDNVGSAAFNQRLSEQRAQDVASILEANGVDASRIKVKGYGEWKPIAPNANLAGRQQNRRVEIILLNATPKLTPRQGT